MQNEKVLKHLYLLFCALKMFVKHATISICDYELGNGALTLEKLFFTFIGIY